MSREDQVQWMLLSAAAKRRISSGNFTQCGAGFDRHWQTLCSAGEVDLIGSHEYWRVLLCWILEGSPVDIADFIVNEASYHPTDADGVNLGDPPRVDLPPTSQA